MADATGKQLRLVVVTPERAVLDVRADAVVLPMFDGELGVLPQRAPLIGRLGAGELRYTADGRVSRFFVEAGFVQVRANEVTVLTDRAQKAEDVTHAAADAAATAAAALPANTAGERAARQKARDRATGLKRVAAKTAGGVR